MTYPKKFKGMETLRKCEDLGRHCNDCPVKEECEEFCNMMMIKEIVRPTEDNT